MRNSYKSNDGVSSSLDYSVKPGHNDSLSWILTAVSHGFVFILFLVILLLFRLLLFRLLLAVIFIRVLVVVPEDKRLTWWIKTEDRLKSIIKVIKSLQLNLCFISISDHLKWFSLQGVVQVETNVTIHKLNGASNRNDMYPEPNVVKQQHWQTTQQDSYLEREPRLTTVGWQAGHCHSPEGMRYSAGRRQNKWKALLQSSQRISFSSSPGKDQNKS